MNYKKKRQLTDQLVENSLNNESSELDKLISVDDNLSAQTRKIKTINYIGIFVAIIIQIIGFLYSDYFIYCFLASISILMLLSLLNRRIGFINKLTKSADTNLERAILSKAYSSEKKDNIKLVLWAMFFTLILFAIIGIGALFIV